jgi:hypothetical protein
MCASFSEIEQSKTLILGRFKSNSMLISIQQR